MNPIERFCMGPLFYPVIFILIILVIVLHYAQ